MDSKTIPPLWVEGKAKNLPLLVKSVLLMTLLADDPLALY